MTFRSGRAPQTLYAFLASYNIHQHRMGLHSSQNQLSRDERINYPVIKSTVKELHEK